MLPIIIGLVLGPLAGFIIGTSPILRGQSAVIVIPLLGLLVSLLMWLVYGGSDRLPSRQFLALALVLATWFIAFFRNAIDHTGYNYLVLLVPALIGMVLVKPPRASDTLMTAKIFGLALVLAALAAEVASLTTGRLVLTDPEFVYTWLGEVTGTTKRWVGPFLQENYAGPIAAYVLVFALTQRGWYRWGIGIGATWMVLASTSSTAALGVLVGLAVLAVFATSGPLSRFSRRSRGIATAGVFLILALVVALRDTTFNGRTTVWSSYLDVWQSNPLAGVGTSGIDSALRSGQIPLYWTHAHNVPLDLLVKYGLLGLALILMVYALSAWGAFRAAQAGISWPLAIVVMFIAMGLMEVPGDWITWNIPMLWLLLAILGSQVPRLPGVNGEVPSRR